MKVKCLMVGAPGCGKGTQSEYIAQHFEVPVISTSDVIRASLQADSAVAQELKALMAQGHLIDDRTMWQLLCERVAQADCARGFILDGFPRTKAQLDLMLAHGVDIEVLLFIDVPDAVLIQRLVGRRVHKASGRTYHTEFKPPKVADVDDVTGEPLVQREDDTPAVVVSRLQIFREQAAPILHWAEAGDKSLKNMFTINGQQSVDAVKRDIMACF